MHLSDEIYHFIFLGQFTVYISDLVQNMYTLYCFECFATPGHYLQWDDNPHVMSVCFYVSLKPYAR